LNFISYKSTNDGVLENYERLKKVLRATDNKLDDCFAQYDLGNKGVISNLEFRNALRQLNLGLTTHDIDALLSGSECTTGGIVNYKEFIKKVKPK
jgi:Ca2+-binding EF-hand superfamily protein